MSPDPVSDVETAADEAERMTPDEVVAALGRERLLAAVGREVSAARDIADILDRVLEHLAGVVRFKGGSIALIDDGALGIVAARGVLDPAARDVRLPVGAGIAGWVAAHGQAYRSGDLDAETQIAPAARDVGSNKLIRSYLAVPLISRDQTLGILQIDSAEPFAFSDADQELLEAVAAQVANAVERARLHAIVQAQTRALEQQNEQLRATAEELTSQNNELRAVTEELLTQNEELLLQRRELAARAMRIEELAALAARHAAELDATIESISDGIWIVRFDGSLLVNSAARAMYGLDGLGPLEGIEDVGRLMEVSYADGRPVEQDDLPLAHALRGEHIEQRDEIVTTRATGKRTPVSVSSSPLRDASGAVIGAVSIHRDMTRFHETQQVREQLLSTVSHELRTPVTSIKGLVQLTIRRLRRDGSAERAMEGLELIEEQVNRLVSLVDDLLDVNRIDSRRLELHLDRLDLCALVRLATQRLQTTTERHQLRVQESDAPLWIIGDAHRLEQVLDNLLSNAIKYSPAGGDVEIAVRAEGEEAVVTVRDHGIGIPETDRAVLFERFGRAGNVAAHGISGFGLGLFISREIMQRHHGRLWLAASDETGSTFALALPSCQ